MTNDENEYKIFFNHHAPQYMENVFTRNTAEEVKFIAEELALPPGSEILDVGCGTGRHSVELAKKGYRMTGVDISSGMLNVARKTAEESSVELNLIEQDVFYFQSDKKFDAAISLCEGALGLIGLKDNPIERDLIVLQNINRALKPKARFIMTVLNGLKKVRQYTKKDIEDGTFDPINLIEIFEMEYDTPDGKKKIPLREKGFTGSEIKLMLHLAGFETLEIWGGTAGAWAKRKIDPDEYEIMVIARKDREI